MGNSSSSEPDSSIPQNYAVRVFYASLSGTTKQFAVKLSKSLNASAAEDLSALDVDAVVVSQSAPCLNVFLLPSYNVETALDSILAEFKDAANDFRVGSAAMQHVRYALLGIGHSEWKGQDYCRSVRVLEIYLDQLGARKVFRTGEVDTSEGESTHIPA